MTDNNNSRPIEKSKYRVSIPDADEKLRKICMDATAAKYGKPVPDVVRDRLEKELAAIKTNGYAIHYLIGAMIAEQSAAEGYPISTRGMLGSALVSYLCDLTAVNPLPNHFRCPECGHFEMAGEGSGDFKVMGYDLEDKTCPDCGAVMLAEGANIEPEVLMGMQLDREPDIVLNVAPEIRSKMAEYLKSVFGDDCVFRAGVKVAREDGNVRKSVHPGGIFIVPKGVDINDVTEIRAEMLDDDFRLPVTERDYREIDDVLKKYDLLVLKELSMLARLEKDTGFAAKEIRTNDDEVLDLICREGFSFLPEHIGEWKETRNREDEVISALQPKSFSELVRISAFMHGTEVWEDNAEILIRDGKALKDCISTRDDVMQELMAAGMDRKQAYVIMNRVLSGKSLTGEMEQAMTSAGIPDWYIESCNKIGYLFPKSHMTEYTLLYWKLAYYKLHFLDEYEKTLAY